MSEQLTELLEIDSEVANLKTGEQAFFATFDGIECERDQFNPLKSWQRDKFTDSVYSAIWQRIDTGQFYSPQGNGDDGSKAIKSEIQEKIRIAADAAEEIADELEGKSGRQPVEKFTLTELCKKFPTLNPPVIEGLFREGETVNIISMSKVGKSWLVYYIALCIILGRDLFDKFKCSPGKVLLIDNELHKPTLASRVPLVGAAMECFPSEYSDQLEVWPLRGKLRSLEELAADFDAIKPGTLKAIILDAKYRFLPAGVSEVDNGAETQLYNLLDRYAEKLGAAFILVHHSSKGGQSDKRVTDVGSGAGAQSRAADAHLVLREHQDEATVVLDAAVRSFAPIEPIALKFEFPLWVHDEYANPKKLKSRKSPREQQRLEEDKVATDKILLALSEKPNTSRKLRERTGMGRERLQGLLDRLMADEQILANEIKVRGNLCNEYYLPESDE